MDNLRPPTRYDHYQYVLYRMPHGTERRAELVEVIREIGKLAVNRPGLINLRYDPDVQKLLKKGTLRRGRERLLGGVGRTFVYVA